LTAPVVRPERKEDANVVVTAPLKDAAVVAATGGGAQRRGGRLGATRDARRCVAGPAGRRRRVGRSALV
jgi:hypothetical protein